MPGLLWSVGAGATPTGTWSWRQGQGRASREVRYRRAQSTRLRVVVASELARLIAVVAGEAVPYPCLKSVADKAFATALLVLASPVAVCTVAGMALDMLCVPADRGPFLYRERRISRGREFELLKLRVVRVESLTTLDADGYVRLLEADRHNLTVAGRFIKRWYLDELPQLLNIVRGDMSLVGPRPWPVAMVKDQLASGQNYRTLIQAGWTGPAQISKGSEDPVSYQQLDLAYVDACRNLPPRRLLALDLKILAQTALVLLRGQGLRY